jgi:hypothetical protein
LPFSSGVSQDEGRFVDKGGEIDRTGFAFQPPFAFESTVQPLEG